MEGGYSKLVPCASDERTVSVEQFDYRAVVGALMYLVTCTRPDLAFVVGQLSRFVDEPSEQHVGVLKKVLRYLITTKRTGIRYDKRHAGIGVGVYLHGFSDSNWAGDLETRKSTTGHVFTVSGGAVTCASRRQTITAQSTAEAEYVAAAEVSMEGKALLNIVVDILPHATPRVTLGVDSSSSYVMAVDPTYSRRTRHIEI